MLVFSSHPQRHILRFVFLGVLVNPVPDSCFPEVSAAPLCSNGLHTVSFIVQYIVTCIRLFFQPVILCFPQQILHDLCCVVFVHIVQNKFTQDFLGSISSFLKISTNPQLSGLRQLESISNENSQSNHGFIHTRAYPRGGGSRHEFAFDTIEQHLEGCAVTKNNVFVFVDHVDDSTAHLLYPADKCFVHANIPLESVVPYLTVKMLLKIAKLHHIKIGSHVPKSEIIRSFDGHSCASCDLYRSIFTVADSKSLKAKNRMRAFRRNESESSDAQIASKECHKLEPPLIAKCLKDSLENNVEVLFPLDSMLEPVEYPPPPFNDTLSHKIISDFCADSNKSSIEEAGCGVCGQLVPTAQLTRIKAVKNLLTVLEVPDVTRVQRKKISDRVRGYKGPVLDYSCGSVCKDVASISEMVEYLGML